MCGVNADIVVILENQCFYIKVKNIYVYWLLGCFLFRALRALVALFGLVCMYYSKIIT